METINEKLKRIEHKLDNNIVINIMIIGLGSVGLYLLEYLVSMSNSKISLIVVGRNKEKLIKDVNIIKTAAIIRNKLKSPIYIESECNLDEPNTITPIIYKWNPDFIINCSRVFSGIKYGSISWNTIRAYGIWTPLAIKYSRNIMQSYEEAGSNAISINTSYSDAVLPWLKCAGKSYFDFGSGNLNHLVPRMKLYIAKQNNITDFNSIDITIATSHFHDVVISKEGHSEGQEIPIFISYQGEQIEFDKSSLLNACAIPMPTDQKRNMMNASSNFNIIDSIITSLSQKVQSKFHSPGVLGNIGGYPFIIDGTGKEPDAFIDASKISYKKMLEANLNSIYLDGIKNVSDGNLYYSDELISNVKKHFGVNLPKIVRFDDIEEVGDLLINEIINR